MTSSSGASARIFKGMGLVLGGKAGAGLLSLAYLVIAARALGPHDYGILVLVHSYVMAVCGIVAFPAWQAIIRYGAEASTAGHQHRLARLLRFGAVVELSGGIAAVLVAMALAPIVGPSLGWPAETVGFAIPYCLAVLGSVRSTPAGYLQLIDRFDLIGLHNLVQPTVRLLGAAAAWLCGWGLKGFLIAWLTAAIAEFAVLWTLGLWCALRRMGPVLLYPEHGKAAAENRGLWRFLIASNADVTLSELTGRIVPLIVGWILGPTMAGLFAVAQRATVIIAQPAQILGNTAYAELARLVASGHGGSMMRRTLCRVIGIALVVAAPVVVITALFSVQLVTLLAGPAFTAAAGVMILLIIARMIAVVGPPCSSALSAMGHPAVSMSANLFAGLIFLPALPWLLETSGLAGAGMQAIGQAALASGLLVLLVWRKSVVRS